MEKEPPKLNESLKKNSSRPFERRKTYENLDGTLNNSASMKNNGNGTSQFDKSLNINNTPNKK